MNQKKQMIISCLAPSRSSGRLLYYNLYMPPFNFRLPLQVRYGDLDPQGHVNNAHTLTFIEQARFAYLVQLGLWDGKSFLDLPLIVADVHIAYLAPIYFTQNIRLEVRVSRIGTKSLTFEYRILDSDTDEVTSTAETVMVFYDYRAHASKPVSEEWRRKISTFEGRDFFDHGPRHQRPGQVTTEGTEKTIS